MVEVCMSDVNALYSLIKNVYEVLTAPAKRSLFVYLSASFDNDNAQSR